MKTKRLYVGRQVVAAGRKDSKGEFVDIFGELFYRIENYDRLPPFFVSVVSDSNHWLFVSTSGGLSAGRVSPDNALFPYYTVDKIHENAGNTGPFTALHVTSGKRTLLWRPFRADGPDLYKVTRNLYKNSAGNKIVFEERNHDLGLEFRYSWSTSDRFGFLRESSCTDLSGEPRQLIVLDGLLNILPAGVDRRLQLELSYLVDAYKANELVDDTRLALYTLAAGIVDEAIPMESLRATTVWSQGFPGANVFLTEELARAEMRGETVTVRPPRTRGLRGAYILSGTLALGPNGSETWSMVADVHQTQKQASHLREALRQPERALAAVADDVVAGRERLRGLVGSADGLQKTGDQLATVHHFANTLFNCMRGGVFADGVRISAADFEKFVGSCNRETSARQAGWLNELPEILTENELRAAVQATNDRDLLRIFFEYLPITFSRRHGDPSRPWNRFAIQLKDSAGQQLLGFEGNWRDIFQNWEALSLSCPVFLEHMIAKFVNASTIDGYNPYRITRGGIEWEEPDPEDPWASIGYWGDHQIIYLLKLLEAAEKFQPGELSAFLPQELFCYADVPYRIASYEKLIADPRATIDFDTERSAAIKARAAKIGADGKLLRGADGGIYYVTLAEKLLVPLLAKLSNFIPGGGIWMNTQRPEWNDANNALVGYGVSVVTLNYLRRYLTFCLELFERWGGRLGQSPLPEEARSGVEDVSLSEPVATLLRDISGILSSAEEGKLAAAPTDEGRRNLVDRLSTAGSKFRSAVYAQAPGEKVPVSRVELHSFLEEARRHVDQSLRANQRPDRLFHAYNLLQFSEASVSVEHLPEMLEGQVAALSSGLLGPEEALRVLRSLRKSALYLKRTNSYMLYPDRELPSFLARNVIPETELARSPLLTRMLAEGDERLVYRDAAGQLRFVGHFVNARALKKEIEGVGAEAERELILAIYEKVFRHHSFTGRSGTMFAFEGLGSIYWHMVAKLLLAVQETFFAALDGDASAKTIKALGAAYYDIRAGLGFNKTPAEYGAFPTDPYSHTPGHAGAQQPGMTGQVKEEIMTRLGELGVRVIGGTIHFQPALLRESEFLAAPSNFAYVAADGESRTVALPAGSLAFSFCQVPIIYNKSESASVAVRNSREQGAWGAEQGAGSELSAEVSRSVFRREGRIQSVTVGVPVSSLLRG